MLQFQQFVLFEALLTLKQAGFLLAKIFNIDLLFDSAKRILKKTIKNWLKSYNEI